MKRLSIFALLLLFAAGPVWAQQAGDVNARILEQGTERSQIMRTLHHLTDVFGPRLTGSPNLERAGQWALEEMTAWGLENARAEPWDWGNPGWTNERLSVHLAAPLKEPLVAEVLAWTPGTDGAVTAEAIHLVAPDRPTQAGLDAFFEDIRAEVAGKIVLVGATDAAPSGFRLPNDRLADEDVQRDYEPSNPQQPRDYSRYRNNDGPALSDREVTRQVDAFLLASGAAVRVNPARMAHGLIRAFSNRTFDPDQALPTLVMRDEDYGRIARLLAGGHDVALEVEIENRHYPQNTTAYNYVAEIPGSEYPEEVVMLGGHLDSWHAATGATDNATGVAVMMEAVRLLKTLGLQPRRTIRIALWTGEEQGLRGSQAYVAEHFGTFEDPKADFEKFGGYVNLDMGTGRVRGATVFGPKPAAEVLENALTPFDSLGVAGARPTFSRSLGGSDHTAFNAAGLPGISLGQDPIEYFSHTWHTNVDTYERVLEEDVQQAAVVTTALIYHLATRDALLPRFPAGEMPAAPPASF